MSISVKGPILQKMLQNNIYFQLCEFHFINGEQFYILKNTHKLFTYLSFVHFCNEHSLLTGNCVLSLKEKKSLLLTTTLLYIVSLVHVYTILQNSLESLHPVTASHIFSSQLHVWRHFLPNLRRGQGFEQLSDQVPFGQSKRTQP